MDDRERLYEQAKALGLEPHSRHGVTRLREMIEAADVVPVVEGDEAPEPAPNPAPKPDMVEVIVMVKRVHIQRKDLGKADPMGVSEKFDFKSRIKLKRAVAEMLAAGGMVEII